MEACFTSNYYLFTMFIIFLFFLVIYPQVVREYDGVGVQVLLASPTTPLCVALKSYGFFNRYSSERIFPTVSSAVSYAKDGQRVVGTDLNMEHYNLVSA